MKTIFALITLFWSCLVLAAAPAAVTTAISDAAVDSAIIAGTVLVLIIGILVFRWLRKAVGNSGDNSTDYGRGRDLSASYARDGSHNYSRDGSGRRVGRLPTISKNYDFSGL